MNGYRLKNIDIKKYFSLGTDIIASLLVGLFIGHNVDRYYNTKPIAVVVFMGLGLLSGGLRVYRSLNQWLLIEDSKEKQ